MPRTLQSYIAESTKKAAAALEEAYLNIPVEQRGWSPEDKGRSANDQLAECAMLTGRTSMTISSKSFGDLDFAAYFKDKDELAKSPERLIPLLTSNMAKLIPAIETVADSDLDVSVDAPWGLMLLSDVVSYSYWNLTYHLGQVNYIASLLGCLK